MPKIMQINITCGRGSTGKLSQALYRETLRQGYEARFVYSAYTPTLPEAVRIENKFQNYLRRGLNRYFGRRQKHSRPGTKRLIRYIEKEKPDLIHLHNVQQNAVDYPVFFEYLKEKQIPVVYTLHDCWSFTGGCYHFTVDECCEYRKECYYCKVTTDRDDKKIAPAEAFQIKKKLIGGNSNIYPICVSQWLAGAAKESYMGGMLHLPVTVYNGVDTKVFCPTKSELRIKHGISDKEKVVLGVAGFWTEERKGLPYFIFLSEHLPDNYRIVLIGQSADILTKGNPKIIGIRQTEDMRQLAEYYSMADVFVNASIEETFGMTTAEALACGTPAVAFDSTACPEVISEETGIVSDISEEALLAAVRTICERGKEHYSEKCVARIKQYFEESVMTENYFTIYRSILDETGK